MKYQAAIVWAVSLCLGTLSITGKAIAAEEEHICRYCAQGDCDFLFADADAGESRRKYAPARYVDVLNLKLDVTPNFQKRTIAGTATLQFAPIGKPLSQLRLDAVHLDIAEVRSSIPIADHSSTTEDLTVTFSRPIAVGEHCELVIRYSAEPRQGLYFRTPELGYPAEDTHLFTQGEPQRARHWFPCHDYPNERSSTEVICHVPAEMTVLSNGVLISETVDAQTGLKAVHWRQEKPHVSYLITLVAGYFTKLEGKSRGVPLAFYSQPTAGEHAAHLFKNTAEIMDFFSDEIGVTFPWDKYYQVTVRDFQPSGMENTSMTTIAHRTLHTSETENIRSDWVRTLDAHEMAHQWFGDLVTCKDWSQLWLNEGFATYYSYLYEGHRFGRDAMLYKLYRDAQGRVLPRKDDRRPIVFNEYQIPWDQFDYRAYPKGSWVLHMLRSQLGAELYRQSIKTYLERHALTSVTTADLSKTIEEVSGQSFDRFFDQWVYHASHPSLKVTYKWLAEEKLARVTVEQTQKVDEKVLLFEFPTLLRFWDGEDVVDHAISVKKAKQDFYFPLSEQPTVVRFDPEFTVLAEVEFKKPDKMLKLQLENTQDVVGRILAVHQLADRKTSSATEAIGRVLQDDKFYGVQLEAAKALEKIGNDEALAQLAQAKNATDARVRWQVIASVAKFDNEDAKSLLLRQINEEQNPAIVAEAVRGLGRYRGDEVSQVIEAMLKSVSFKNEIALAAIAALGIKEDPEDHPLVMQTLRERANDFPSRGLANCLRTLANLGRRIDSSTAEKVEVERFLRKFVQHSKEPVRIAAIAALGRLGESRSTALLEKLAEDKSGDGSAKAALASLKQLRAKSSNVPKELGDLRKSLDQLKKQSEQLQEQVEQIKAQKSAKK